MRWTSRRRRPTLMPLVALAGLSLAVTLPALSSTVHAAAPQSYTTVRVRPGDTLWSLAVRGAGPNGDIQATVDTIVGANHLAPGAPLTVGRQLRVPR